MDDNKIHMLTTVDNPYNPFTHFDEWYQFDTEKGYNTLSYLGRVVNYDGCYTEELRHIAREDGMQEIINRDPLGIFIKVTKEEEVKPVMVFNTTSMPET